MKCCEVQHTKTPCAMGSSGRGGCKEGSLPLLSCSEEVCACLCFQLPLEFTAGTGEGSQREVNALQDTSQSCWGKGKSKKNRDKWREENKSKKKKKKELKDKSTRGVNWN